MIDNSIAEYLCEYYIPTNLAEYPAIGHDRRYDNLRIQGASGLFTDTRAIGAGKATEKNHPTTFDTENSEPLYIRAFRRLGNK
jgi:hypothetical protein